MTNRELMQMRLRELVIDPLRKQGFTGQYPHLRRIRDNGIELIGFQANKYGGSFTVEVSAVFPNGKEKNYRDEGNLPWEAVTVWDTQRRYRLKGMFDGWFYYRDVFGKRFWRLGMVYYDTEKTATPPKGYKLLQSFDENTALDICREVNYQLKGAFRWLYRLKKRCR